MKLVKFAYGKSNGISFPTALKLYLYYLDAPGCKGYCLFLSSVTWTRHSEAIVGCADGFEEIESQGFDSHDYFLSTTLSPNPIGVILFKQKFKNLAQKYHLKIVDKWVAANNEEEFKKLYGCEN